MKTKLIFSITIFFLSSLMIGQNSKFGNISYEKAVNLSGKQRMLSQKIAKVKMLKLIGASTNSLNKEFVSSITLFDRNLKILELNSKSQSSKVKAMLRNEVNEWTRFKSLMEKAGTGETDSFLNQTETMLNKCHAFVLAIEEASKFSKQLDYSNSMEQLKIETINLAGKQRMLSQKLCLYYAACRLYKKGKKADMACGKYQAIYKEINEAINSLLLNELNTPAIDSDIAVVLGIIESIEAEKKEFSTNKMALQTIVKKTNKMLEVFNSLTSQYSL